jgi:hypothetical protein
VARSFAAVVLKERHLLALIDTDPEIDEPFSRIPEDSAFRAYHGAVVLAPDLEDQTARVRVELWDSLPDAPAGGGAGSAAWGMRWRCVFRPHGSSSST